MARDRNFQRKQKDTRMPARDSHGEDRMAARQGEQDFDLRRARDAPSSGASRNRRQAAPVQAGVDDPQSVPEMPKQAETYESGLFASYETGDTAAQELPSQGFSESKPYMPETGQRNFRQDSQRQGSTVYRNLRQEEPRQKDSARESPQRRNAVYHDFRQEDSGQEDIEREDFGQDRHNTAYRGFRQDASDQPDSGQEISKQEDTKREDFGQNRRNTTYRDSRRDAPGQGSPRRRNATYQNFRQEGSGQEWTIVK